MHHRFLQYLALFLVLLGLSAPSWGKIKPHNDSSSREYFIIHHNLKAGEAIFVPQDKKIPTEAEGATIEDVMMGGTIPMQGIIINEEGAKNHMVKVFMDNKTDLTINGWEGYFSGFDFSPFKSLQSLRIEKIKINQIDVTKNRELRSIRAYDNPELRSIHLGRHRKLIALGIADNPILTDIEFVNAPAILKDLQIVNLYGNRLSVESIQNVIDRLPDVNHLKETPERYYSIWLRSYGNANRYTTEQLQQCIAKNWIPRGVTQDLPRLTEGSFVPHAPSVISFTTNRAIGDTIRIHITRDRSLINAEEKLEVEGLKQIIALPTRFRNDTIRIYRILSQNITFRALDITGFDVPNSQITQITFKNCNALVGLNCNNNQLTSLDLSECPNIGLLECMNNKISNITFAPETNLRTLYCSNNQLTQLDLRRSTITVVLYAQNNKLTSLLLGNKPQLIDIFCNNNQLSSIDVTQCPKLERLQAHKNQISSIDLSGLSNLYLLNLRFNQVASIDLSQTPKLKELDLSNNELDAVDLSACPALEQVGLMANRLNSIDVTRQPKLQMLAIADNNLKEIDVRNNHDLRFLNVTSNILEHLDIRQNPKLKVLMCDRNFIKEKAMWDIVNNLPQHQGQLVVKYYLGDFNNVITDEQVAVATAKGWLVTDNTNASYAGETTNHPSAIVKLTTKVPAGNKIFINVKPNLIKRVEGATLIDSRKSGDETQLTYRVNSPNITIEGRFESLGLTSNQLTQLDVTKAPQLKELWCTGNELQQIDLSQNPELTTFSCIKNKLTTLDVSHNTKLNRLFCYSNNIQGNGMEQLIHSLPTTKDGIFAVINTNGDLNYITAGQVKAATDKGWNVIANNRKPYRGSDVPLTDVSTNVTTLTTSKRVGETVSLNFYSASNFKIEGAVFVGRQDYSYLYRLTSQHITVRGDLEYLNCANNNITAIDATRNPALAELRADNNQLSSINLSQNSQLQEVSLGNNQLTQLDLSQNKALRSINCPNNRLTQLLIPENDELTEILCQNNAIKLAEMETLVKALPQTNNGRFVVFDTQSADEANFISTHLVEEATNKGWSVLTAQRELYEGKSSTPGDDNNNNSGFITFTTEKNVGEEIELYFESDGDVASGDLEFIKNVERDGQTLFLCRLNKQTVTLRGKITHFDCSNSQLSALNVRQCPSLTSLFCENNNLSQLDVSQNRKLKNLGCGINPLSTIELSNNTALEFLAINSCKLQELDVTHNTALTSLYCSNNLIKSAAMDRLIHSLPLVKGGLFVVTDAENNEGNVISKEQAQRAEQKGWKTQDFNGTLLNILSPTIDNAAPLEMYDLSGRRVQGARSRGVIILRQGGRTTKVVR